MAEREYSKSGESMCPKDGWVVFRNSELLCGRLGKGVLGGNKVRAGGGHTGVLRLGLAHLVSGGGGALVVCSGTVSCCAGAWAKECWEATRCRAVQGGHIESLG
jgi:hypothetical protein